jgi:hypothetical protein
MCDKQKKQQHTGKGNVSPMPIDVEVRRNCWKNHWDAITRDGGACRGDQQYQLCNTAG